MPSPFYTALPPPVPIDRMTPLSLSTSNRPLSQADRPRSALPSPNNSTPTGSAGGYAYEAPFYVPAQQLEPPTSALLHRSPPFAQPLPSPLHSPYEIATSVQGFPSTTLRFSIPLMNSSARDNSFKIETDNKGHATRIIREDGYEVARFDWATPLRGLRVRIMGGKEMKGREWARLQNSDGTRSIIHRGVTYVCKPQYGGLTVFREGSSPVATCYDEHGEYVLNAYVEALQNPGLLDICVAAMVLLQSGHSLGDRGPVSPSPAQSSQTQSSTAKSSEEKQSIGTVFKDAFLESLGDNVGQAIGAAVVAAV